VKSWLDEILLKLESLAFTKSMMAQCNFVKHT